MRLATGTSGYSYKEWKGSFYPEDLPQAGMLRYYAGRLTTVEINNTFYRMPKAELLERWAGEVGEGFTFALKAPERITHRARLAGTQEAVNMLWDAAQALGAHLGPILFQLPPHFRKDVAKLEAFLAELPVGMRAAFEFRHDSWEDEDVRAALARRGAALCPSDVDGAPAPELFATAPFGYMRLRRQDYTERDLSLWLEKIRAQPWDEAFAFFKHEDAGAGARLALELARLAAA